MAIGLVYVNRAAAPKGAMSLLFEVVTSEAWLRAISFKTLWELKPEDFNLELLILNYGHWLEFLEAWQRPREA